MQDIILEYKYYFWEHGGYNLAIFHKTPGFYISDITKTIPIAKQIFFQK